MKVWVQCCHRKWTRNYEWLPMPADDWSQRRRTFKTTPVWNLNLWIWSGLWPRSSETTSWAPSSQSSRTTALWLTWTTPSWEQWPEQRWVANLAPFDFELKFRRGRDNGNADALSRMSGSEVQAAVDEVIHTTRPLCPGGPDCCHCICVRSKQGSEPLWRWRSHG